MVRVDFFVDKDMNKVYFNEVNIIFGFISILMYLKFMEFSSILYFQFIDKLIFFVIEKNEQKKSIKYSKEG